MSSGRNTPDDPTVTPMPTATADTPPPPPPVKPMPRAAFVDMETGGLRVDDTPWEIAVLTVDEDGQEGQFVIHIADFQPAHADPKALQLAGFYDRHPLHHPDGPAAAAVLVSGPDPDVPVQHLLIDEADAARVMERLLRDRIVVACNPAFDLERHLAPMLHRHGYAPTWFYRPVCATVYAAGRLGLPLGRWSNGDIGRAFGVDVADFGTAHQALVDAHYARALLVAAQASVTL